MLYIIKNISSDNIVVGRTVLQPGSETKTHDLEPFKKMVEKGYLKVKDVRDNNEEIYNNYVKTTVSISSIEQPTQEVIIPEINATKLPVMEIKDKFVNDSIRQNIMEGFFNFYISREVSEKDLKFLKWFYKNIGFTNKVKPITLDLLEDVDNYEDLAAVLLNNVYPELLEIYLNSENNELVNKS